MELEFQNSDGSLHRFTFESNRGQTFSLTLDGKSLTGNWQRTGPNTISLLTDDGTSHLVHLACDDSAQFHLQHLGRIYRLLDPGAVEAGTSGGGGITGGDINEKGEILSPMPGKVVGLPVAPGDRVAPGDLLVVLESMKMENPVLSPVAGTVVKLSLEIGAAAALGDPLIQLAVDEED
jgi:biotin carboxyl carrier protein